MAKKPTYEELKIKIKDLEIETAKRKQTDDMILKRAEEFAALYETSLDITKPHDLSTLLETIVKRAAQLLNCSSGGMYLCDADRKEVRCVVSYKTPDDYTGITLKYGEGAAGIVAQTKEPLIIDDYRIWSKRAAIYGKDQPFTAVISVPMIWQDEVIGVVHVLHDVETRRFAQSDLDLLTLFASQAATAVNNAQLVGEVQSYAAELEKRMAELEKVNKQLKKEIKERKRAEEKVRDSEERYRAIFDQAADSIMLVDGETGTLVEFNEMAHKNLGYTREEFAKIKISDFEVIESEEEVAKHIRKIIKEGADSFETKHRTKGGEIRDINTSTRAISIPGKDFIQSICRDITDRKRMEEALLESEKRYEMATSAGKVGVWDWNLETNEIYVDPNLKAILGYADHEIRNHLDDWGKYVHPDDVEQVMVEANAHLEGLKPVYEVAHRMMHRDGSIRWFLARGKAIRDKKGKPFRVVGTDTDITDRMQAEGALKGANEELLKEYNQRKMLSKRLIDLLEKDRRQIAMELHDHIGQMLTSCKIDLEILHDRLEDLKPELRPQVKAVQEKAVQIMKDVKSISHGLRPTMIDALGVVSSLRDLFSEIKQQTNMEVNFFSRRMPKHFDQGKELAIYRIAQEALTNVIRHARAKNIFVNLVKKNDKLSLSVEDDGVGFDQDKVMKTSKRKGPLGLLIMRERAIQFDGEFTIESQPGKGTHVLVEIPL